MFCYLVTKAVPAEFRLFLLRYADLLRAVDAWTLRLLVPRRLLKAQAVYRYAVRDTFLLPLSAGDVKQLDWYFRVRRGETVEPSPDPERDVARSAQKYGAARFAALHRHWERDGIDALWSAQSVSLGDHIKYGSGRVEVFELAHQYLQLTPLVGVA